ncbi:Cys-tRNA(Pro) deacylase [Parasporobacterium paucivorans]
MRILEKMRIGFTHYSYDCNEFMDGLETADMLNLPHEQVFKTLVTVGNSKDYFVFVIPVEEELDMKKAAKAAGEKSISMLPLKDLTAVTGYVRGGCTAIGMKKQFKTIISGLAERQDQIYISAGKLGAQLRLRPTDFCRAAGADYGDVTAERN